MVYEYHHLLSHSPARDFGVVVVGRVSAADSSKYICADGWIMSVTCNKRSSNTRNCVRERITTRIHEQHWS